MGGREGNGRTLENFEDCAIEIQMAREPSASSPANRILPESNATFSPLANNKALEFARNYSKTRKSSISEERETLYPITEDLSCHLSLPINMHRNSLQSFKSNFYEDSSKSLIIKSNSSCSNCLTTLLLLLKSSPNLNNKNGQLPNSNAIPAKTEEATGGPRPRYIPSTKRGKKADNKT